MGAETCSYARNVESGLSKCKASPGGLEKKWMSCYPVVNFKKRNNLQTSNLPRKTFKDKIICGELL